jgi:hypothetical protein
MTTPEQDDAEAEAAARRVKRTLLMGVGLLMALASLFAGVIEAGRAFEMGFAAIAGACVLLALRISVPPRPRPPAGETPAVDETPRRDG